MSGSVRFSWCGFEVEFDMPPPMGGTNAHDERKRFGEKLVQAYLIVKGARDSLVAAGHDLPEFDVQLPAAPPAPAAAPAAAAPTPANGVGGAEPAPTGVKIDKVLIPVKSYSHEFANGRHTYKVRGGDFTKYGVVAYDDSCVDEVGLFAAELGEHQAQPGWVALVEVKRGNPTRVLHIKAKQDA